MRRIRADRPLTAAEHAARYREKFRGDPVRGAARVESSRAYRFAVKYGITIEQYDQMVEAQRGLCAACGHAPTGRLHVDHNHDTGEVRGLLCGPCNRALGYLESPKRGMWDAYLSATDADKTASRGALRVV